jgi:replication-associated recombination protein RarA
VVEQEHLPEALRGSRYYFPSAQGDEKPIQERLNYLRSKKSSS